jgi:hypothetical protein
MSDTSHILGLPYIQPAQAQKHVTHNEAIRVLDALVQLSVEDRDQTAPPATPTSGDRHILAANASGVWTGLDRTDPLPFTRARLGRSTRPKTGGKQWFAKKVRR